MVVFRDLFLVRHLLGRGGDEAWSNLDALRHGHRPVVERHRVDLVVVGLLTGRQDRIEQSVGPGGLGVAREGTDHHGTHDVPSDRPRLEILEAALEPYRGPICTRDFSHLLLLGRFRGGMHLAVDLQRLPAKSLHLAFALLLGGHRCHELQLADGALVDRRGACVDGGGFAVQEVPGVQDIPLDLPGFYHRADCRAVLEGDSDAMGRPVVVCARAAAADMGDLRRDHPRVCSAPESSASAGLRTDA
mmetsp:Transcript_22743/g.65536  ORF Transcript_22743/g.65536 Transcript_22743/m.65536 type:complete len:246 (+) Transcript_22743:881-1618(+)